MMQISLSSFMPKICLDTLVDEQPSSTPLSALLLVESCCPAVSAINSSQKHGNTATHCQQAMSWGGDSCMLLCQVKEEGWWLVLGDVDTHELLALKRISFADLTTARLTFPVINGAGREMAGVTLFFVSDSYLGLDQQYFVPVPGKQQGRSGQGQAQTGNGRAHSSRAEAGQSEPDMSSRHQNGDGDAARVADDGGQMRLEGGHGQVPDASVKHAAKAQRSNARQRRG